MNLEAQQGHQSVEVDRLPFPHQLVKPGVVNAVSSRPVLPGGRDYRGWTKATRSAL